MTIQKIAATKARKDFRKICSDARDGKPSVILNNDVSQVLIADIRQFTKAKFDPTNEHWKSVIKLAEELSIKEGWNEG